MQIADHMLDEDGRVDQDRWLSAGLSGATVGTCHCGSPVRVDVGSADQVGRSFLAAVCLFAGHEAVIPRTRVIRPPVTAMLKSLRPRSQQLLDAGRARDAAILGERD